MDLPNGIFTIIEGGCPQVIIMCADDDGTGSTIIQKSKHIPAGYTLVTVPVKCKILEIAAGIPGFQSQFLKLFCYIITGFFTAFFIGTPSLQFLRSQIIDRMLY